jgi:hypothetical protein
MPAVGSTNTTSRRIGSRARRNDQGIGAAKDGKVATEVTTSTNPFISCKMNRISVQRAPWGMTVVTAQNESLY